MVSLSQERVVVAPVSEAHFLVLPLQSPRLGILVDETLSIFSLPEFALVRFWELSVNKGVRPRERSSFDPL